MTLHVVHPLKIHRLNLPRPLYFFKISHWMLVFVFFSMMQVVNSQTKQRISIHSENNQIIDATTDPPTKYLNGDVKVFHEGTFMYCDTAVLRDNDLKMYFNVVLMQNDTIKIFADSLYYQGDSLIAYLYGDIILENGRDKKLYTSFLKYDVKNKIGYYTKNAKLLDKTAVLISKRGRYLLNEKKAYFYENVKITDDDFVLVGDSVAYTTTSQRADFLSPVRITKDTSQIYSQSGWFNLETKTGDFIGNAQYLEGKNLAKADTISYDGSKDLIYLKSDTSRSEYISATDTAYAKVIFYDQKNERFRLNVNGWYRGQGNEVKGDEVFYDKITQKFNVVGRSMVSDPPNIIEADTLDYNKAIKFGKADGHVIWRDTAAKTAIIADHVLYRGEENFLRATNDVGKPLFTTEIDGDTLFLKADTLKSFRAIKERLILPDKNASRKSRINKKLEMMKDSLSTKLQVPIFNDSLAIQNNETKMQSKLDTLRDKGSEDPIEPTKDSLNHVVITDTIFTGIMDTIDYFIGDNNVRLYKNNMQSICDSLSFNRTDSIFTLFVDPYVWSDSSQISGDTIDILLKSKKIDKLIVRSEAKILSTEDLIFFNQIKGRFLEAYFKESKIYKMDLQGNAQVVYYMKDEGKAYTGVNLTEASQMTFYFKDNKVTDIRNYISPKSRVLPMKDTDHEGIKVKGFKWNIEKQPKSSSDL